MTLTEQIVYNRLRITTWKELGFLDEGAASKSEYERKVAHLEAEEIKLKQAIMDGAEERAEVDRMYPRNPPVRKTADLNAPWLVATGDERVEACSKRLIE